MIGGMQDFDDDSDRVRAARSLFPDLAARLDRALERHRADAPDDDAARLDEADRWLDAEAARVREGELRVTAFGAVTDVEARGRMESAFRAAGVVADWAGVALPEPEAFAAAGVDLARFGSILSEDPGLAAVPAPYGLGYAAWAEVFRTAAVRFDDVLTGDAGLALSAEVEREFEVLDRVPDDALPRVTTGDSLAWTLRLVPATPAPPLLGLGYAHGPHVSLPEMLMLQLTRLENGSRELLDANSFTWLANALGEGRLGARHIFDDSEGVVRISSRGVFNQGPHMGARQPVA